MKLINNRPSLRQIEAFLAVAEAGSFSRAAERCGLSQPALSQAVRDLEAHLGLQLFARTTRRVDLTAEGVALREGLTSGIGLIDAACGRARETADLKSGHLRIAAPPLLSASVLPVLIAGFAAGHRGLTFELSEAIAPDIPELVRSGRADLGIGTLPDAETGLDRRILLSDRMTLVCPPDHRLARSTARWADLAGWPLVALSPQSGLRQLMDRGLEAAGVSARPVITVQQVASALALVEAGMGVAVFPSYAVRGREGRLAAVPLEAPRMIRQIVMVQRSGHVLPPSAAGFARHLAENFAKAYRASDPTA